MRKLLIMSAALATGALSMTALAEQQTQQTAANEGMKATGKVMEVDKDSGQITVNDQTYVMPKESGGAAMMPQVGAEVTLYYEEQNGQKMITRIGQAQ
jgi:Cu/Ag efflux protein CusF